MQSASKPLAGKVAFVTGSTSGIGLGIARKLASAGADVALNGFGDAGEIESLRASVEKECGVKVRYYGADMSKPMEVKGAVQTIERDLGRLDVLVNNAGIQHTDLIENFPDEKWDAVIAINLSSAFHGIKAALPGMKARGFGRIVNIASAHGLVASAQKVAYVASKHGIVGMTKVVALETAEQDITCNAICPGWVLTPLVQKQIDARAARDNVPVKDAEKALLGEKEPSKRFTTPEQLGELVLFLCGPGGGNMTGVTLSHDGGWTAQ